MRVVILEDSQAVSQRAADIICQTVHQQPDCVLGLATGGTPLATYQQLVDRASQGLVSFSQVTTFNLDEYVGLPRQHRQSYWHFMHKNLFELADFNLARCFLPDGLADDLATACDDYERQIAEAGGIELQLLGIGTDGHIAFNEPGSSLGSRTRVKALAEQTRLDNARFFGSMEEVPELAVTMGVGSILASRQVLLLATGSSKADAVEAFIEGPITAAVPASALQLHRSVTVLLDRPAASRLRRLAYYERVEQLQRQLEQCAR